jgi:hypothetical protein
MITNINNIKKRKEMKNKKEGEENICVLPWTDGRTETLSRDRVVVTESPCR